MLSQDVIFRLVEVKGGELMIEGLKVREKENGMK